MYFRWTGRIIAVFFTEFWLLAGKPFFNFANTLIYFIFILLIQFHIAGSKKMFSPLLFLAVNIVFWIIVPAWGQNFLWLCGTCNYLWTTTIILFFLVPFRKKMDNMEHKLNVVLSVLMFFVGGIAGWCNENSGAAVLFMLVTYLIIKIAKKSKFTLFEILGIAGFIFGFFMLICAPGNYARLATSQNYAYSAVQIVVMFIWKILSITNLFVKNQGYLLIGISFLLLFDLIYRRKHTIPLYSICFVVAAFAGTYSMLLAPGFPDRAFIIVTVFSTIALGNILMNIHMKIPGIIKRNRNIISALIVLLVAFSFFDACTDVLRIYFRWYDRVENILVEKEKGNLEVEVKPIMAVDKHTASYGLMDVMDDKNIWPNTSIANYFGLKSIIKNGDDKGDSLWVDKGKRLRQLIKMPWETISQARK